MEFLYFAILIGGLLIVSLYFYKKNKNDSNLYAAKKNAGEDSDADEESEETEGEDEKADVPEFDSDKFDIIYCWVSQKVNKRNDIDYDILKEKIIKNFKTLPDVLEDARSFVNEDQEEFLKEVMGQVEYSSPVKYFLVNKGRKLSSWLSKLLLVIAFTFFVLLQIEIRKDNDTYMLFYLLLAVISFALSFVFAKLSKRILSILLRTLKPGDCIKIICEPDELIEQKVKVNQLSKNESIFNKTSVFVSKKKLICEEFLAQSPKYLNTINNKLCLYLVIDYLKNFYSKEAYREYLLEKEIDALEFVCAFNPWSISANFELALLYLESKRFDDFYEKLLKCRSINGYDCLVESCIKSCEFYYAFCEGQ